MNRGNNRGKVNKPPLGRRWKPGQSGNPRGRPRDASRIISPLHSEEVKRCAAELLFSSVADVRRIAKSKTHSVVHVTMAKALLTLARRGDLLSMDRILESLLSKAYAYGVTSEEMWGELWTSLGAEWVEV